MYYGDHFLQAVSELYGQHLYVTNKLIKSIPFTLSEEPDEERAGTLPESWTETRNR
jgi:hypothetical protein